MEKRAALFTEKGVIPFGLEALVDRLAFIHDTQPPSSKGRGKRMETRKVANRERKITFIPPTLFFTFSLLSLSSFVNRTCPNPPPLTFGPIDVYFLTKAPGKQSFLPPPYGTKVECTLYVARGKPSRTSRFEPTRLTVSCKS